MKKGKQLEIAGVSYETIMVVPMYLQNCLTYSHLCNVITISVENFCIDMAA